MNFNDTLEISFSERKAHLVRASMPVTPAVLQPYGYLHGGATISLLETVASEGAMLGCADGEAPFGVNVHVAHRKSMRDGRVYGEAHLQLEERTSKGWRKQTWDVTASDADGAVVSEGTVICLIVPRPAQ